MTWTRATPVLVICLVFDALGSFFAMFWLIGPALAAAYCVAEGGTALETWTIGLLGTKTAAAVCSYGAVKAGAVLSAPLTTFGTVMDMAIGLFGWLTVGLILIITNARIFKENASRAFWFVVSLLASEVPIIGAMPALSVTTWKLYHTQIKKDGEALQQYEREHAAALQEERRQHIAELMHIRTAQLAQTELAARAAKEAEDGHGSEEIPEEMRKAA